MKSNIHGFKVGICLGCVWVITTWLGRIEAHAGEWLDGGKIPRIDIQVSPEGMQILREYVWIGQPNDSGRTNVPATVTVAGKIHTNVALHLKGSAGSFRPVDSKPGLTLNFDKWADGQTCFGLQKFHLNNSIQDPSFACDILAREVFLAAGIPTPRASHARVTLNGADLGLYVLVEGWNKQFLKRHFKNAKGNLYDGGFGRDINQPLEVNSGENPEDRSSIEALLEATEIKNVRRRMARLKEVLDVDRFLTFAALEVMLTHNDGYCIGHNNYRVFHDRTSNKMVFLPHGMDQLFGRFRSSPEYPLSPAFKSYVSKGVLETPEGQKGYLERVAMLNTNIFQARSLLKRVNQIEAKLRSQWPQEDEAGLEELAAAFRDLRARISRRCASITDQLENPRPTLEFQGTNSLNLSGLSYRSDNSRMHQPRHELVDQVEILGVKAGPGRPRTSGSWRKNLFLPPGHYELSAMVRVARQKPLEEILTPGTAQAVLRLSGDRDGFKLISATQWTRASHVFDIHVNSEQEMVFEVRGIQGEAQLDVGTLALRRWGPPPDQE